MNYSFAPKGDLSAVTIDLYSTMAQAEGTFKDITWSFRARWNSWDLEMERDNQPRVVVSMERSSYDVDPDEVYVWISSRLETVEAEMATWPPTENESKTKWIFVE